MKLTITNAADFIAKYNSLVTEQITSIDVDNNKSLHDFCFAVMYSEAVGNFNMILDAKITKSNKKEVIELNVISCNDGLIFRSTR